MKVICDVEADDLKKPQNIWVISCIDIDTGDKYVFNSTNNLAGFKEFASNVTLWIGHNFLGYDLGVLNNLLDCRISPLDVLDTLVLSRLFYYSINGGHSLAAWGERLGHQKSDFDDFSQWSQRLEDRCVQDTLINFELYKYFLRFLEDPQWAPSIEIEHHMTIVLNDVHETGFCFNYKEAQKIHKRLSETIRKIDDEITEAFPPRAKLVREITPRLTKHGTLHKQDFRWLGPDPVLDGFFPGVPFSVIQWVEFNPGSVQQVIERLDDVGWEPYELTPKGNPKLSENNLETISANAPEGVQKLVQRRLLANRVSTLNQWFAAYNAKTGRVHGTITSIGAWTQRCNHQNPNMGNVPSLYSKYTSQELKDIAYELGKELRSLWTVPHDKKLVGCDAEGIQLRIFAHYVNDPEFTQALIAGNKEDGTDAHSINAQILESTRDRAKTFIYAFLLNCGVAKTALIFGCDMDEAQAKRERFIDRYPGLRQIREELIPRDIARGYFEGFDGRKVIIPKNEGNMIGYVLGGYLQNGESCIMKHANVLWRRRLRAEGIDFKQVNFVHDEWQTEVSPDVAEFVGQTQAQAITDVGIRFGLHCPMAGNYQIGDNWYETH